MNFLLESDILRVVERIDSVFCVITERLVPAFSSLQEEALGVEKKYIHEKSLIFSPDYLDEAVVSEDAYHAGLYHYEIQSEMKVEFENIALTWMFHLFEKSCTEIFATEKYGSKKKILNQYGLDTSAGSNWYKCNREMRVLANAIKHGPGPSQIQAETLRPDLFRDSSRLLSNSRICISVEELRIYMDAMRSFWVEFFTSWWSKNMNSTLDLPSLPTNT